MRKNPGLFTGLMAVDLQSSAVQISNPTLVQTCHTKCILHFYNVHCNQISPQTLVQTCHTKCILQSPYTSTCTTHCTHCNKTFPCPDSRIVIVGPMHTWQLYNLSTLHPIHLSRQITLLALKLRNKNFHTINVWDCRHTVQIAQSYCNQILPCPDMSH